MHQPAPTRSTAIAHRAAPLTLLAIALASATAGCGWLHARTIAKRTNPAYRSGPLPGPTLAIPVFECPRQRRGVELDRDARGRLADTVVPALWQAAGVPGEPALRAEPSVGMCRELYLNERYPSWSGNAALREAVRRELDDGHQSVLAMFVAPTYACEEKLGTVRDHTGAVVGSVGTGDEVCAENGSADLMVYVLSSQGEMIWQSGMRIDLREDPAGYVGSLFEGFPRDRLTLDRG